LVAAMIGCLVPLFAIPLARTTFAVQLPPASVMLQVAVVALAAIGGLTLWRRLRPPDMPGPRPADPGSSAPLPVAAAAFSLS
jgi:hypothetical protein